MMEALMWVLLILALAVWAIGVKVFSFRQRWRVESALLGSRLRLWRLSGDTRWLERRRWE